MKYKVGDKFLAEIEIVAIKRKYAHAEIVTSCQRVYDEAELDDLPRPDDMTAEEAWEIAKKLFADATESELNEVFGKNWTYSKLMELSPQQAKAKLGAWEADKKIKVGDEITAVDDDGNKMSLFVQKITKDTRIKYWGIINYNNGTVDTGYISHGSDIKKTGRHIDIQGVLEQIGG